MEVQRILGLVEQSRKLNHNSCIYRENEPVVKNKFNTCSTMDEE
jgi:hypothetical protein